MTTKQIQDRIGALEGRRQAVDVELRGVREQIAQALAEDSDTTKLQGKAAGLTAILDAVPQAMERLRAELAQAQAEEERARRRELRRRLAAVGGELEKRRLKIGEAAEALAVAERDYDRTAETLRQLAQEAGAGDVLRLLPSGKAFRSPELLNDPASNLRSVFAVIGNALAEGRV